MRHRRKNLTKKEAKIAAVKFADGEPINKIMVEAGYAETTANHHPHLLTGKPEFKEAQKSIQSALIKKRKNFFGNVATKILEGLDATQKKRVVCFGKVTDEFDDPDYYARHKYIESIFRLFGINVDNEEKGITINISQLVSLVKQSEKDRGLNDD